MSGNTLIRSFWLGAGFLALIVGIIGIFLPLLPTVPFLLLAAFCFERGSERLHNWLMSHDRLGPPIHNWNRYGAISTQSKIAALTAMIVIVVATYLFGYPTYVTLIQIAVLAPVALFIVSRPTPPKDCV